MVELLLDAFLDDMFEHPLTDLAAVAIQLLLAELVSELFVLSSDAEAHFSF